MNDDTGNPMIEEPLIGCLHTIRHRLVVVGSVARGKRWPKDLDLLWDLDNEKAKSEIKAAIEKYKVRFESPFIGCWTFRDYGWMVEIISVSHGPMYRKIVRRAGRLVLSGIEFRVAQLEDAPKEAS
jgi:predicted nucleotidyltransferase